MHILIATPEFVTESTYSGGLANCVADFARIYSKHDNKVTIVTLSDRNEIIKWEQGITVYRIKVKEYSFMDKLKNFLFPYYPLYDLINRQISKIICYEHVDIIHYPSSCAMAIKRPPNIPVTVMMSTYLPIFRQVYKPKFKINNRNIKSHGRLEKQIRRSIKKADSVFAPSKIVAKYCENDTGRKITVIESPVLVKEYELMDNHEIDILDKKKYFLFFGTLGYLKGVALIAKTLSQFFENNEEIYFVFLGEQTFMHIGDNKVLAMDYVYSCVPERYHSRVIYIDKTPNKSLLYSIVKNSLACVLPSRFDNLPNTCIEAMALGKVVIGTRGASFDELITDEVNGFLIEIDNDKQLLEKMEQILVMSTEQLMNMGEKAKETLKRLDPEVIYPQLMKFYQQTINEFRNKRI